MWISFVLPSVGLFCFSTILEPVLMFCKGGSVKATSKPFSGISMGRFSLGSGTLEEMQLRRVEFDECETLSDTNRVINALASLGHFAWMFGL